MRTKKSSNIKRILSFFLPYKKRFFILALILAVAFVFAVGSPILTTRVITYITEYKLDDAFTFLIGSIVFLVLVHVFHGTYEVINRRLAKVIEMDIRDKLIESVNNTKLSVLDKTSSGIIINRISNDSSNLFASAIEVMSSVSNLINSLGYLIYIAFVNWIFFLFYVAMTILLIGVDFARIRFYYNNEKKITKYYEKESSIYSEIVRGYKDIKCINVKQSTQKLAHDKINGPLELRKNFNVKWVCLVRFKYCVSALMLFCVFALGIVLLKNNAIDLATFIVCHSYYGRIQLFSDYSLNLKQNWTNMKLSGERIIEIIDCFEKEKFGTLLLTEPKGVIELKNVTFAYDKDLILKDINMKFSPNQITAIVGRSGCGKSTILSLLNYLYTNYEGEILLDGEDLRTLSESSIRDSISVVNQTPYLFNLTIRDNMKLVNSNVTDEEIYDVLKRVNIYNDVVNMPDQLDTVIGENGISLSGGQRQRLAIARTLLKDSKIIILDEATSALDNNTQSAVVDDIEKLKETHTIIVIAHRLSTIKNADKIYVMDDGKICGEGKHIDLIKNNKIYKKLYYKE